MSTETVRARAPRPPGSGRSHRPFQQLAGHRPAQPDPHQADARDADGRHGPAGDVRAALRLRLRRLDRRRALLGGYRELLLAGIMAQTIAFASFIVAIGLTADLDKGIVDRMRSCRSTPRRCWWGGALRLIHSSLGIVVMSLTGLIDRLADPELLPRRGAGLRAAAAVGLRDDLGRDPRRLLAAFGGGGERRHVHHDLPAHLPLERLRADRGDVAGPAHDRGVEPDLLAGAGGAGAVGQRPARRRRMRHCLCSIRCCRPSSGRSCSPRSWLRSRSGRSGTGRSSRRSSTTGR